jgi:hypothetical protein
MMLKDRVMSGWLGHLVETLHYPLPILLFVVLTLLGWWFSRGARQAAAGQA